MPSKMEVLQCRRDHLIDLVEAALNPSSDKTGFICIEACRQPII